MNKYLLVILCLLSWYDCTAAQQSAGNNDLTGYLCASASSGELKSATMTVKKDGGTFEKLENGDSILKLNRGDFVEFSFTLPESASGVEATIKYQSVNGPVPCFIRWNGTNPKEDNTVLVPPKKNEKLFYKKYELKDPKRNNVIRVTGEGTEGLNFYNIIIKYKYSKPSDNKDNFNVTLDYPDPAKSIADYDKIEFKWTGVGEYPKDGGWMTIQFCDNNNGVWKTVPGAEYIDINGKDWNETSKGKFEGKKDWENHGLTEMPDFRIVFTKGQSPIKKAKTLYDEAIKLKKSNFKEAYKKFKMAQDNIKQASDKFPQKKEYSDLRKNIARELNPFDTLYRYSGEETTIKINNITFQFVYCPKGTLKRGSSENEVVAISNGFWFLNQEVSQIQWEAIMKENPSKNRGNQFPVENISWEDCKRFCMNFEKLLNQKYDNTKQAVNVTLPTSVQWEYVGQLGKPITTRMDIHYNSNKLWGAPNPVAVKNKTHNVLGIYNMQGNVAEWCLDGKKTSDGKEVKYVRGGSCQDNFNECQITSQKEKDHSERDGFTGFRFIVIPK